MPLFDPQRFNQAFPSNLPSQVSPDITASVPAAPAGMFGAPIGSPRKLSLAEKLGMIGDVLTRTPFTQNRLAQEDERSLRQAQAAYEQSRSTRPVIHGTANGGFVVINPVTGEVITRQDGVQEPTALQRNYEYLSGINPTLGQSYIQAQANPMQGIEVTDPSTGQRSIQFYPRGGGASAPTGVPDAAIAYLRANPQMAPQFDQKYGAGSSQRYLQGGAAPQAPTPFRP